MNSAKNIVMLDVPAGDFTATADVSAAVAKVYQGAGLIAWQDMDNYVRSGLTFVGGLSPSGRAIETDRESGATFSAVSFADRPGSSAERLRLARAGDTITTSYWDGTAWVTAATTDVSFDTTQVGVYALAAQDGTVLPAAFDSFTIEHAPGADVTPTGPFVLQADGDAPYLVADGDALELSDQQPTASLRLTATDLGDGAVALATDAAPLVLRDGALVLGAAGDEPTPMRLTDAGGGKVVLRAAADPTSYVVLGAGGALVAGAEADAVRFALSEVDEGTSTLSIDGDGTGASISDDMFGIFYEDINYAADGGLYAELVRNRSFEFNSSDNGSFTGLTAWQVLDRSGSRHHRHRRRRRHPPQRDEPQPPAPHRRRGRRRRAQHRLQQRLRGQGRSGVRRLPLGPQHHGPAAHRPPRERRRRRHPGHVDRSPSTAPTRGRSTPSR